MANPQKEDGYIGIANDIIEELAKIRISGEAMQVLLFIFRKTYGWHKKWDKISLSQFVIGTGLSKPTICRALKKLKEMNIITIDNIVNEPMNKYKINKDYETWKPLTKKSTLTIMSKNHCQKSKSNIDNNVNIQKKLYTKETNTKEKTLSVSSKKKKSVPNPNVKIFIDYFFEQHLKKVGEKYHIDGGKDGNLVKLLLGTYDIEKLKLLCDAYFNSNNKMIKDAGYSIGLFKYHIPKLFKEINSVINKGISGDKFKGLSKPFEEG